MLQKSPPIIPTFKVPLNYELKVPEPDGFAKKKIDDVDKDVSDTLTLVNTFMRQNIDKASEILLKKTDQQDVDELHNEKSTLLAEFKKVPSHLMFKCYKEMVEEIGLFKR